MPEFFSSDGSLPLQFLVIFGVIVVLMMTAYLLFRRIAGRGLSLSARAGSRSRQPRLGIVDIYELDRQRQLILLRRDNVEHLLLVGGPNDVVVERNVQRGAGSRLPSEVVMRPEPAADLPGAGESPALPAAQAPAPLAAPLAAFEMPLVVPPPLPGSTQAPEPQAPRLDPDLFAPDAEGAEPVAARPEPVEAAGGRARARNFLRRTPPPLATPQAEPASQRAPGPAEPPVFADAPPVMAAREPRPVDPAVLSDMARQLETALLRPSSAVRPAPGPAQPPAPEKAPAPLVPEHLPEPPPEPTLEPAPAAPEPAPPRSEPPRAPDPIAARMAAAQGPSEPDLAEPAPPAPSTPRQSAAPAEPAPAPRPEPAPKPAPKPAPAPRPAPAPKPDPAPAPAKPPPEKGANPFSVEEIEAEFARLLGRPLDKKG